MLCQNCKKNEASVRYTQIVNGEKIEMYLCDKCSKELGIDNKLNIDFSSFLGDLLTEYDNHFMPYLKKSNELKCDKCNLTYSEFMRTGKFGCDNCYTVFAERIDPILKKLQGSNRYTGRKADFNKAEQKQIESKEQVVQKEPSKQEKIDTLKTKLKQLVQEENYEEAAKVRDMIKELEVQE